MISRVHLERKMNTEAVQNVHNPKHNIVWFDGEMTGLDIENSFLIEAAIIITDGNLKVLAESPNIVINQPDEILDNMNEWCKKQHALSGLSEKVRKSSISIGQADQMLYEFIKPFAPKGQCPLAGNSIHMDRMFIRKFLPKLENHLSYRLIDVSTLKELFKRWKPEVADNVPVKSGSHRALDDIKESVEELQFYKNHFLL